MVTLIYSSLSPEIIKKRLFSALFFVDVFFPVPEFAEQECLVEHRRAVAHGAVDRVDVGLEHAVRLESVREQLEVVGSSPRASRAARESGQVARFIVASTRFN